MENNFNWSVFLSVVLLFATLQSEAQTIKRQNIGSYGSSTFSEGVLIQQTVGQPYFTAGYYGDEMNVRPGFQQPPNFSLVLINSTFNFSLDVYPNPAAYSVTIESSDVINNALLQVVDMNGKLILNEKVAELKSYLINCELWSSGFYFITLYDEQQNKYSSKLIIAK
ncbi:T9SS type A sorting domain-containing protein [bacterium AH-315-M05]|nr:T9SS type A sorting domain-containing protein [bacterium AH-315-M05]